MEALSNFLHQLVLHLGYAGLFIVMFLGNIGLPAGTEVVMPTAGALAGSGQLQAFGPIPGWVVVAMVGTVAEVFGASVLYTVGWFGGLPFVHRYGKYVMFREHEYDRVHSFYEKHGRSMVFWCRFIPFVRGVASLPPGISRMPKRYFLTFTALGSLIFCFSLAYLGEVAGRNVDTITAYLHDFALAIVGVIVLLALGGFMWWRMTRKRAQGAPITSDRLP